MIAIDQLEARLGALSRAGTFGDALALYDELCRRLRLDPSDQTGLAAFERVTALLAEDAVSARDLDTLRRLYGTAWALFETAADSNSISIAAIGLADGLNVVGKPKEIDPVIERLRDMTLAGDADKELTVRFGHVLFAQIRAYFAAGEVHLARVLVMENRRELVSPAFLADLSWRHGTEAGPKWAAFCGAAIYALARDHTTNPRWPFKTIEERFDFATTKRAELWNGALAIDLPAIWSHAEDVDEPGRITCWAKGYEAGHFYIHVADMMKLGDGMDLSSITESQNDGRFRRDDMLERYDWLVERSMIQIRGGRSGRMVMINLTLVTLALYDGRDDFQCLVAQLEDAIARMKIDVDRLPRAAGTI